MTGGMRIDPRDFQEIPVNEHGIAAGSVLLPTRTPIVQGGGTSLDFVLEQEGDQDTFIFMLGAHRASAVPVGLLLLEGVFLSAKGPGFHPTWSYQQLMRETAAGGWTVVPTPEVLASDWVARIEARMNA